MGPLIHTGVDMPSSTVPTSAVVAGFRAGREFADAELAVAADPSADDAARADARLSRRVILGGLDVVRRTIAREDRELGATLEPYTRAG